MSAVITADNAAGAAVRPIVRIAHRGGGSLAPENSIEGIECSIGFSVDMVEVDVRMTSDSALVLSHDDDPLPGFSIRRSRFADVRVETELATLDDALDLARGKTQLNLDIKDPAALERVIETVRRHEATDECIVSCLSAPALARFSSLEPALGRFLSYPNDYGNASRKRWMTPAVNAAVAAMRLSMPLRVRGMLSGCPGASATIYYKLMTPRLVDAVHRLGLRCYTWTVDDLPTMLRLAAMGVDGITSNRPDLLAQLPPAAEAR